MSDEPIAWYITYGTEYGYNDVLFFRTEQAAHDAIEEMDRINEEEGNIYEFPRGNVPTPLYLKDIKEKFEE